MGVEKENIIFQSGRMLLFFIFFFAQVQAREDVPRAVARFLLGSEDFSRPFTLGIKFDISPGWHLYWINPGDSGLPIDIRWKLPEGFKVGEILYPTPQKFIQQGLIGYGYEKEVVLLCEVTPPRDFRAKEGEVLSAHIDWLVCKESCLRETATVEIPLVKRSSKDIETDKQLIASFRAKLPRSSRKLALSLKDVTRREKDNQIFLEVKFSGSDARRISDFYPYPREELLIDHRKIEVRDGQITILFSLLRPLDGQANLRGLLIHKGKGYEIDIPIK